MNETMMTTIKELDAALQTAESMKKTYYARLDRLRTLEKLVSCYGKTELQGTRKDVEDLSCRLAGLRKDLNGTLRRAMMLANSVQNAAAAALEHLYAEVR